MKAVPPGVSPAAARAAGGGRTSLAYGKPLETMGQQSYGTTASTETAGLCSPGYTQTMGNHGTQS